MEITIDKFGRVVIPKRLRDHLGLVEGTTLSIQASGDQLILKASDMTSPLVRKGRVLVFTGTLEGDLQDAVKKDRMKRADKFLRRVKTRQA